MNTTIKKIIFVIIILSLIITGIGGYLYIGANNYAAKINNTKISYLQLQKVFQEEKEMLKQQLGDEFNKISENKELLQIIQNRALERVIGITLFNEYAKKLGINVSDTKVKHEIYNMPLFQTNSRFDNEKYKTILLTHHIHPDELAKEIKQNLINRHITDMFIKDEFILNEENKMYAKLFLQQREIKILTLYINNYISKQNYTNKEIEEYYQIHKKNFITPKQVRIKYIKLDSNSQWNKIVITDKELENFYKNNINNFVIPAQKHYSIIQLATEKEAKLIKQQLSNGANFNKLAFEKSIDKLSSINNGDIGWIDSTSTPSEIINANLTEIGQISDVIKFARHYVIFRLNGIKPEILKSFQSVKKEIIDILKNKKAIAELQLLEDNIKKMLLIDKKSFSLIEKTIGIKSISTDWFDKNHLPNDINFDKVSDIIFNEKLSNDNNNSKFHLELIKINNNCLFIIQIQNDKPEVIQTITQAHNELVKLIKFHKANIEMEHDGNQLLSILRDQDKQNKTIKLNIKFNNTKIVKRFEQNDFLTNNIFDMPLPEKNKPSVIMIKDKNNNLLLIKLIKVIPGNPTEDELIVLSNRYQTILSDMMMESMMLSLRNKAKIIVK